MPLPDALTPEPGELGAAAELTALRDRVAAAYDALVAQAEAADLDLPARSKRRTGRQVVLHVGAWPENRTLDSIVDDARQGRTEGPWDQDTLEVRVLAAHRDATDQEAIDAVRRARDAMVAFLDGPALAEVAALPVRSLLGPVPVVTLLHAVAYQLAVAGLDLEPCGAPAGDGLLHDGLFALVDTTGALTNRERVTASLTARTPDGAWGFGATPEGWRARPLGDGEVAGPVIEATPRVILDVTSGRGGHVPELYASGQLRVHDLPGMLPLLPVLRSAPGIPGTAALSKATTVISGVGSLLSRLTGWGRPPSSGPGGGAPPSSGPPS